ncbi:hypothetical protein ACG2OD_14725 [Streptomyces sp. PDY-4]|uniref:hypothetical protein n=1 Tax=Streptomyces sp. PDY-4 TaxID=3376070 RepID=UPI0037B68EDE
MRVQRTRHTRAYVQVPNEIAQNKALSLEAIGLAVYLLSLPDANRATVERITSLYPNGRRAVANAMNELIEHGYVKRAKVQDPQTGRWVTITSVSDLPTDRFPTVGVPTGQAVGGSPQGEEKTEAKKNTTPNQTPEPEQQQEEPQRAPEGPETGGEGQRAFLSKIDREMGREARRIMSRLSLHASLPMTDREIERLAPKVLPWVKDGFSSEEILQTLTAALPEQIGSVPGLISHRLRTFQPVKLTPAAPQAAPKPAQRAYCDVCEATFPLGHTGGTCRTCQDEMTRTAARFGVAL